MPPQTPVIVPVEWTQHQVNYIKGKDQTKWRTGIRTSKAVLYKEIYPGIHLAVYGIEDQLEYDWIVKPGSDPGKMFMVLRYNNTIKIMS